MDVDITQITIEEMQKFLLENRIEIISRVTDRLEKMKEQQPKQD